MVSVLRTTTVLWVLLCMAGCGELSGATDGMPAVPPGFDPEFVVGAKGDFLSDGSKEQGYFEIGQPVQGVTEIHYFHGWKVNLKKGATVEFTVSADDWGYFGIYRRDPGHVAWGKVLARSWLRPIQNREYATTTVFTAYQDGEYLVVVGSPWEPGLAYSLKSSCKSGNCAPAGTCSWGHPHELGKTTAELKDKMLVQWEIAIDDASDVLTGERAQILSALKHWDLLPGDAPFETVFSLVEGGKFTFHEVLIHKKHYDWLQWNDGDGEAGIIFEHFTTRVAAVVRDGVIKGCQLPSPTYQPSSCQSGSTLFAETTVEYHDKVTEEGWFTNLAGQDNTGTLTKVQEQQLRTSFAQLHALAELPSLDQVFDWADGHEISIRVVAVGGTSYDWIIFWAGDTEVGAIFEKDTSHILAIVGDQDIAQCGN